jgi:diaminopimelate epimerase
MKMRFIKIHCSGNDFILIDEMGGMKIKEREKAKFAEKYCSRRKGIGADGVLFISSSKHADFRLRVFQPDSSEAEMCGNGLICAAVYAGKKGYLPSGKVQTPEGIKEVKADGMRAKLDMGYPKFERKDIPALKKFPRKLEGCLVYAVNTGVPHAVVFDRLSLFDKVAEKIRWNPLFPEGANVNFARVERGKIHLRTYERGVEGETLSCGTGAVAVASLARKIGIVKSKDIRVITKGGELKVYDRGNFFLEGKAEIVFEGFI